MSSASAIDFAFDYSDQPAGLTYRHPMGISSRASPLRAQARYQDPVIGRFLSIDPVGFKPSRSGSFNRYSYTENDPVNAWDPTGEFGRGSGFTDEQWKKFDKAQTKAATKMTKRAGKLESKAAKRDAKGKSGGDDLRSQATSLRGGAKALSSDGKDGYIANGVDQAGYKAAGGSAGGAAFVARTPSGSNGTVATINVDHGNFGSGRGFQRIIGHESLHTARVGLRDQRGTNGEKAYQFGSPQQRKAFKSLKGTPLAVINPDHIMDTVY